MISYSNREVWPEGDGTPSLIDIGVALGRIPRFCGHTKEWYPVLAHVLTVATILPDKYALYGLLHDSPEACMGDVPTPWKTEVARRREYMLLRRIYAENGLSFPISERAQSAVDTADHQALVAEAHTLGHPRPDIFGIPDPEIVRLTEFHLGNCRQMIEPEISSRIFVEAFEHYYDLLHPSKKVKNPVA
jgi:hypothetical protein